MAALLILIAICGQAEPEQLSAAETNRRNNELHELHQQLLKKNIAIFLERPKDDILNQRWTWPVRVEIAPFRVKPESLRELAKVKNINRLQILSFSDETTEPPDPIEHMKELAALRNFADLHVSGHCSRDGLIVVTKMDFLKRLWFVPDEIEQADIALFGRMKHLTHIAVGGRGLTRFDTDRLYKSLPEAKVYLRDGLQPGSIEAMRKQGLPVP